MGGRRFEASDLFSQRMAWDVFDIQFVSIHGGSGQLAGGGGGLLSTSANCHYYHTGTGDKQYSPGKITFDIISIVKCNEQIFIGIYRKMGHTFITSNTNGGMLLMCCVTLNIPNHCAKSDH